MAYRKFAMDPAWSAQEIADAARDFRAQLYAHDPTYLSVCDAASVTVGQLLDCWDVMTDDERDGLSDIPIIVFPINDFDVWIAYPASGKGVFIALDLCLIDALIEFFSAIPGAPMSALAACVLRGSLRETLVSKWDSSASWTRSAIADYEDRMGGDPQVVIESGFATMLPGLRACINFIILHECAHFRLGHLVPGAIEGSNAFGDFKVSRYQKRYDQELAADEWAIRILSRKNLEIFSAELPAIELMLSYFLMMEKFESELHRLQNFAELPLNHPPAMERLKNIGDLAAPAFENSMAVVNSNKAISGNLQNRYEIWNRIKNLSFTFCPTLAFYYFHEPQVTIEIHTAVRGTSADDLKKSIDTYKHFLQLIEVEHGLTKIDSGVPRPRRWFQLRRNVGRIMGRALSKWF